MKISLNVDVLKRTRLLNNWDKNLIPSPRVLFGIPWISVMRKWYAIQKHALVYDFDIFTVKCFSHITSSKEETVFYEWSSVETVSFKEQIIERANGRAYYCTKQKHQVYYPSNIICSKKDRMFISKLSFWCNFLNKRGCVFLCNIRKMCSLVEKKTFKGAFSLHVTQGL